MSATMGQQVISMDGARRIIDAGVREADALGVAVVVAVVDPGGHQVAMARMDGSPLLSRGVAADKAWTAIAFGQSTRWWAGLLVEEPELAALGRNNRLLPLDGGVPVVVEGAVVGGVGVSGATAEQDHRIATVASEAITTSPLTVEGMRATILGYFAACNDGDAAGVAAHCTADAVHYFPPDMYGGPFVGGATIGRRWAEAVATIGSVWTVDTVLCDPVTATAVAEWTHFKTFQHTVLRGDEWYRFDPDSGLLAEIRAYYASPQDRTRDRLELGGFDYAGRGYATEPPFRRSDG